MVTVFIPATLRNLSGGRDQVEVSGRNVRQVIDRLDEACPGMKAHLVADDDIRPGIAIAVNDEMTTAGLLEPVPEDGRILILPAIGGG